MSNAILRNTKLPYVALLWFCCGAILHAQIKSVGNDTATPIPGAGHDYRQMLSETVSPSNGSLSVRINVPVAKDRGVTVPFSFNYDSAGVHHMLVSGTAQGTWVSGDEYLNVGGWTYGIPLLNSNDVTSESGEDKDGNPRYCNGFNDYIFTDSSGERHAMTQLTWFSPGNPACLGSPYAVDDRYAAQIVDSGQGTVAVADHDGTVFTFNELKSHPAGGANTGYTALPNSIEDRNGNIVSVLDSGGGVFTFTDAAGRTAINSSGFGKAGSTTSVVVAGLTYQITWGSTAANYPVANDAYFSGCRGVNRVNDTQAVITAIQLPNGESYGFRYDSTFGLLSRVTYPNGAYSRYDWGFNSRSDQAVWQGQDANGPLFCTYNYDTPAVQARYVSFDGTNEVLEEDYSYSTTWVPLTQAGQSNGWTSKTSTVTTKVGTVSGNSLQSVGTFTTNYSYVPYVVAQNPYDVGSGGYVAIQVPLEDTIVYHDYGGGVLKTVTKTWQDQFLMSSQKVALDDGSTSSTRYTYNPGNYEVATQSDYDFDGTLLKETAVNYQAFPAIPMFPNYPSILDRPCQMIIYDSSGTNRVAETDYFYDSGTALCGTAGTPSVSPVPNATNHDAKYIYTSTAARGNLTKQSNLNLQLAGSADTSFTFDETGQVTSSTDPRNNVTFYSHSDNYAPGFGTPSGQTNAYLTTLTLPKTDSVNHVEKFSYRYLDGQLASSMDQNQNTTSYVYDVVFGRLIETDFPGGGKTTTTYNDTGLNPTITTSRLLGGSSWVTTTTMMDAAGHPIQSQLTSDPSGTVYTDTTYDGLGRKTTSSTPYRITSDSTYGVTSYRYDALGRPLRATTADGASVVTSYSGPTTTVTDQEQKVRSSKTDGLGRLTSVTEDPGTDASRLNYITNYTYDALDDLIGVNQSSLTRSFFYDSLKRLLATNNPENASATAPARLTCQGAGTRLWTTCYSYDNSGNLSGKTDNRNVGVNYTYDALNRLLSKSYSGGLSTPSAHYCYDGVSSANCPGSGTVSNAIGYLTGVYNGSANSETLYTGFDSMGRVLNHSQLTAGNAYNFGYTYNLAGDLTCEQYPSGRTVVTAYDAANRVAQVAAAACPSAGSSPSFGLPAYVTGIGGGAGILYAPHGAPSSYWYGNKLARVLMYNSRLQPVSSIDSLDSDGNLNGDGGNEYLAVTMDWFPPAGSTAYNNGNLLGAEYRNGGATANNNGIPYDMFLMFSPKYTYDALNRLSSVTESGYSRNFGYDAYGNMYVSGFTGITPNGNTPQAPGLYTNNQLTTGSYDEAGNQKSVNGNIITYDAEGRQVSVSGAGVNESYVYDSDGKRVEKLPADGSSTTVFVYDALGRMAAEYATAPATPSCAVTCYLSADTLGTPRLVTNELGNVVARHDYLPFGEEVDANAAGRNSQWGSGGDLVNQKFTSKERDSESGLDYFGARYYGSALGRFTSPDSSAIPQPVPYADLTKPQSLNLYSYVLNNPLGSADPDGHAQIDIRYTSIGPGYTHSYLVVTDTNGARTYFRAGPSAGGPSSGSSGILSSASGGSTSQSSGSGSNSSNSSSPGSGPGGAGANTGPFGALHAESGAYVPGTIDFEDKPAASNTLLKNDQPAAGYIKDLQQYSDAVNDTNIPYNPLSTNSNAYAAGAAKSLGLTVPTPTVRAPGAGTDLGVTTPPLPPHPPPPPPCSTTGTCKNQ